MHNAQCSEYITRRIQAITRDIRSIVPNCLEHLEITHIENVNKLFLALPVQQLISSFNLFK